MTVNVAVLSATARPSMMPRLAYVSQAFRAKTNIPEATEQASTSY